MDSKIFVKELAERILPFWLNLLDIEYGGSYGKVDSNLQVHKKCSKGGVVSARHLWGYSNAYLTLKDEKYLLAAEHSYKFLTEHLIDRKNGGIYWEVEYDGTTLIDTKHIYAQSFAIYGLSEYYQISQNEEALELAKNIYQLIEEKCYTEKLDGYFEEFTVNWECKDNTLIDGTKGAVFTTNSHLHLLEAYTNLYRVWKDEVLLSRIEHLLDIFITKIYHHKEYYCQVVFDKYWNPLKDTYSYGHDIETSWLLTETLEITELTRPDVTKMNIQIAYRVASEGIDRDGSIYHEIENKLVNKKRVWWAQAEAIVGFYNAYQLTNDDKFFRCSENTWKYIQENFNDVRENSEWFARINKDGEIILGNIADNWKGFYHNARMYSEMMKRLGE